VHDLRSFLQLLEHEGKLARIASRVVLKDSGAWTIDQASAKRRK